MKEENEHLNSSIEQQELEIKEEKEKIEQENGEEDQISLKNYLAKCLPRTSNKSRPIRRVRVRVSEDPMRIGNEKWREYNEGHAVPNETQQVRNEEWRERHVISGDNHHVAIYEVKGKDEWVGEVVSQFEVQRRRRKGDPIVRSEYPKMGEFVMHLYKHDTIRLKEKGEELYYLYSFSQDSHQKKSNNVRFVYKPINEARPNTTKNFNKVWFVDFLDWMREAGLEKVRVDALGQKREVND